MAAHAVCEARAVGRPGPGGVADLIAALDLVVAAVERASASQVAWLSTWAKIGVRSASAIDQEVRFGALDS